MAGLLAALLLLALTWAVFRVVKLLAWLIPTVRVLNRMPHVDAPGTMGWTAVMRDPQHAPHVTSQAAIARGGLCSFRILWYCGVIVADPVLAQQVLKILDVPKSPPLYRTWNSLSSPDGKHENLLGQYTHDTHHGLWWVVRKGIAPAFSPKHIRREFPHVVELSHAICHILTAAGPAAHLDLDNLLQRESMDVIGRIGFAADFGALKGFRLAEPQAAAGPAGPAAAAAAGEGSGKPVLYADTVLDPNDVFHVVQAPNEELVKRWTQPLRFHLRFVTPDGRRGERCLRRYQARMRALLKEVQARGEPAPDDMSVAAHLLRIRDPATGRPLSDEQLTVEIGGVFFAGYETTGHTMAWTLYFLATHPAAESKVCAELAALGLLATPAEPQPRPLEYADMGRLKYLGCCIKEAMRRVPVVGQGSPRTSPVPFQLGGYTVPAGVEVMVPLTGLHNSPANWDRPEEYIPERWEDPAAEYWYGSTNGKAPAAGAAAAHAGSQCGGEQGGAEILEEEESHKEARPPRRFIPFSEGRRACVGQNLAKMNYTATLAILLGRFAFELPPEMGGAGAVGRQAQRQEPPFLAPAPPPQLRSPDALQSLESFRTTVQPAGGMPLRAIPRAGSAAA